MSVLLFAVNCAATASVEKTSKRFFLNKDGGTIEVRVAALNAKETREAVRRQLQIDARNGIPNATPGMLQYKKDIQYRYEEIGAGGRIRIVARGTQALSAVQEFLRAQMGTAGNGKFVAFDFVDNTSLVVVPVTINNAGPFRFLLDTGATNTVLSATVADGLGIPRGRSEVLQSAAGNLPVNVRRLRSLQAGAAELVDVEIAVVNFSLMKALNVDGILGADYLRRFKISIDYDNQAVEIEPFAPEALSMLVA